MSKVQIFGSNFETLAWQVVNDGVMGGISHGRMVLEDGISIFKGMLSSENNGGFSSCRMAVDAGALLETGGLSIRVKGDGNTYQLRVRMSENPGDIAYAISFDTPSGEWQELMFNYSDFKPVFRGRLLDEAPELTPAKIRQIGFLIADGQYGEFQLAVKWIRGVV